MGIAQRHREHSGPALPRCQRATVPQGTSTLSLLFLQDLSYPFPPLHMHPMTCQGMVCFSPVLRAQGQLSSTQEDRPGSEPDLMWLANLTGAHIGLSPISEDPEDRCTIWENLVSLVDFQSPGFPLTAEELCEYIDIPHTATSSSTTLMTTTTHHNVAEPSQLAGNINYKTNPHVRPPYSYATLICMAMEASKKPKITLSAICKWISDNFCYFQPADPTWQSSIRHNLCINKCFIKVTREKSEPGRGAFWKLHSRYANRLKSRAFKEWRMSPVQIQPASPERAQQEAQQVISPAASACSSHNNLEISVELQQLLKEFEEFENSQNQNAMEKEAGQQRKQPTPTANVSRLPSSAPGTQEERNELIELKGDTDWEALLNNHLDEGDFSILGDLELPPPIQPVTPHLDWTGQGQHTDCPQEQEQVLTKPNHDNAGLDETLMATAFLERAWHNETSEDLSNFILVDQGAENIQASLPERDVRDWNFLT
ncbi:forkhead box protein J1-like isoform X1 [Neopelma chrysocephalum]|uniref:forkhead box protein J1-like isoform X1 n=2 Tax=Neopelma chrysocephalum TaxID=114329 RepID=UPI000FCD207D|nr:forkhead box protein J1-like isoform X1 [Neopelma chrysocephalum]XP_027561944.1 forkhead box protein J1-like isoform X1 [Neopelma chrysocephalum]